MILSTVLPDGMIAHPLIVWTGIFTSALVIVLTSSHRILGKWTELAESWRRSAETKDEADIRVQNRQILALEKRVAQLERSDEQWHRRAAIHAPWDLMAEGLLSEAGIPHDPAPNLFYSASPLTAKVDPEEDIDELGTGS